MPILPVVTGLHGPHRAPFLVCVAHRAPFPMCPELSPTTGCQVRKTHSFAYWVIFPVALQSGTVITG